MNSEFEKLGIDEDYNSFYKEEGIKSPNPMQKEVIKTMIAGNSVVCLAQTGSGKTLAYALPTTELMKRIEDEKGVSKLEGSPKIVVVSPTKELAFQIEKVFKNISHHVAFRTRSLVGGKKHTLKSQSFEVLIATPQTLARSLKDGKISFDQLMHLVFDEADNLFEMGFKKEVEGILRFVEYDQSKVHFFSATLGESAQEFIKEKFKKLDPKWFNFESNRVQKSVQTFNIYLSPKEKKNMLKGFLDKTAQGRGIVFVNQKNQLKEIDEFLKETKSKVKYKVIHGDMSQKERQAAHKHFVDGKSQVLIASDIMARGIDIKDLQWVLNFGLPKTPIYYLHRSGRVGRAGKGGTVYNFVTNFDSKLIGFINDAIKSQSTLKMDLIKKMTIRAAKKPTKSEKPKRTSTKQTKRSKLDGKKSKKMSKKPKKSKKTKSRR
jgi:superfamily II DNA/RNA helicase